VEQILKFVVYSHTLGHPAQELNFDGTVTIRLVKMDHLLKNKMKEAPKARRHEHKPKSGVMGPLYSVENKSG
jgi:hypothetical protein